MNRLFERLTFKLLRIGVFTIPLALALYLIHRYEQGSHWIYFWDNAAYWDQAKMLSESLHENFGAFLSTLRLQFSTEYPTLWAVPLALFPPSVLAVRSNFTFLLTGISLLLCLGAFLYFAHVAKLKYHHVLLLFWIVCTSSGTWALYPAGEPDMFSLAFIFLALAWFFKRSENLCDRLGFVLILETAAFIRKTEIFLAVIILFIYFIRLGTQLVFSKTKSETLLYPGFRKYSKFMVALLSTLILIEPILFPGITNSILRNNSTFYSSYRISHSEFLSRFFSTNGLIEIIPILICAFGLTRSFILDKSQPLVAILVIPFLLTITFIYFAPAVAPVHMGQLGIVFNLAAGIYLVSESSFIIYLLVFILAFGTLSAFGTIPAHGEISKIARWLPAKISAPSRGDIPEIERMKQDILNQATDEGLKKPTLYVAGTSGLINPDLITHLFGELAWVQQAGDVDLRDAIQWPLIMNSNFFVVPDTFQWHISKSAHEIVHIPWTYFHREALNTKSPDKIYNLESKINVHVIRGPIKVSIETLLNLQNDLVRSKPLYNIPTVITAEGMYFQPAPNTISRLWGNVFEKGKPFTVWIPNGISVNINKQGQCDGLKQVDGIDGTNAGSAAHYLVFASNRKNTNCSIEVDWK
jgi:hypothetical protein